MCSQTLLALKHIPCVLKILRIVGNDVFEQLNVITKSWSLSAAIPKPSRE